MSNSEGAPTICPSIYYRTTKIFEECSFTWTIENVSFILLGEGPPFVMKSSVFPSDDTKKCKWQVELYPYGLDAQNKDVVTVHLCLMKYTTASKVKTKCVLKFQDAKDNDLKTMYLEGAFQPQKSGQKLSISLDEESWFTKVSLQDDMIKFRIAIISAVEDSNETLEIEEPFDEEKPKLQLIRDLTVMFRQEKFSDVMIVAEGTEFHVHGSLLAVRSPVLAAMLEHQTKEKHEKRIEICDIEPGVVQKLLCFIYTSKFEHTNVDTVMKVLVAADKYAVEDLKEMCEQYLILNMNTSNVLDILVVADSHSPEKLKSKAIDFIRSNKNSQISFSEVVKYKSAEIDNSQLLLEILANMALRTDKEKSEK